MSLVYGDHVIFMPMGRVNERFTGRYKSALELAMEFCLVNGDCTTKLMVLLCPFNGGRTTSSSSSEAEESSSSSNKLVPSDSSLSYSVRTEAIGSLRLAVLW